ncbi:MAG: hypothetical protein AAGF12_28440 [Myxococcota bacterium]
MRLRKPAESPGRWMCLRGSLDLSSERFLAVHSSGIEGRARWLAVPIGLLCLGLAPCIASAQRVQLVEVGSDDALFAPLEASLRELDLEIEREHRPALLLDELVDTPEEPRPAARVFVALDHPERALLVVVDDERERLLIQVFERRSGEDDVVAEQLAEVGRSSVAALLRGGDVGQSRATGLSRLRELRPPPEEEPEPEPEPEPATREPEPPAPSSADVDATLAYSLTVLSTSPELAHGVGLGFGVNTAGALRWSFFVESGYRFGGGLEGAEGRLDRLAVRLGVGMGSSGADVRVSGRLAGGVDVVLPFLELPAESRTDFDAALDPILSLALRVEIDLGPNAGLFMDVGADIAFFTARYLREDDGGQITEVAKHLPVRPHAALGLRLF